MPTVYYGSALSEARAARVGGQDIVAIGDGGTRDLERKPARGRPSGGQPRTRRVRRRIHHRSCALPP